MLIFIVIITVWMICGALAIFLDVKLRGVTYTRGDVIISVLLGAMLLLIGILTIISESDFWDNFWNKEIFK